LGLVVAEPHDIAVETFSTSIAVVFEGDEKYIQTSEALLYEDVIQISYNNVSQSLCADGNFVTVVEVYVGSAPPHRRNRFLAASTVYKSKSIYNIIYQCKGCGGKTSLFRNDAVKRRLTDDLARSFAIDSPLYRDQHHDDLDVRSLQQSSNVRSQPCDLPTPGAFIQNCQSVLQQFITEGRIAKFMTPVSVIELQPVPCGDQVVELETSLLLKFAGNRSNVTNEGLVDIANAVTYAVNTLNSLNGATCDPLFRVVSAVNASLLDWTTGTNATGTNADLRKYKNFKVLVKILFQCRSCTKGTTL
jgi:hypothetical protein